MYNRISYNMTYETAKPGQADVALVSVSLQKFRSPHLEEFACVFVVHSICPSVFFEHAA
jgi:hypothetical protein